MSTQYIQLKNPSGDLLYPRTDWSVILNRPSFATVAQLNTKQDQLTSLNAGNGITIESQEGVLRISATAVGNYLNLSNKPRINGIELNGSLTAADLNIAQLESTDTGDWEVADEVGNVILRLVDGHIVTKYFNSSSAIPTHLSQLIDDVGLSTKQNALVAGTGINLLNVGSSTLISVTLSYNSLSDKPSIASHTLTGDVSYATLNLPYLTDTANANFEVADPNGNVILRLSEGHIQTQMFDSNEIIAYSSMRWNGYAYPTVRTDTTPSYIMGMAGTNPTPYFFPYSGGGGGGGSTYVAGNGISISNANVISINNNTCFNFTNGLLNLAGFDNATTGQVLAKASEGITWITPNYGMQNPMQTSGDLIIGYTNGAPTRLARGSHGQVLTTFGDTLSWTTPFTNPMQASGDLIIGGGSGTPTRLGNTASKSYLAGESGSTYWTSILGTDIKSTSATAGTVLTADGNGNAYWGAGGSGGGMANPMTAVGDIIYGGTNGAPMRLAGGTDNMGKVLTIWADGEPHWADTQHRFTGSTSGVGVVVSVGTNQLSSSAASANNYVLYWSGGPVWGRINPASINTGSSVIGDVIVSSGSTGSATWGKVPGTSISSLSATSGQVLTADGNGYTTWSTPSTTVQTNASLSYQDNNIVVDSNAITAFTTYTLPSNCTQVVITVKHSVYDSSTEGYSWETNTITLDSSASIWTDFPDDPDGYYCTFTFVPGSLTFTDYGEGAQRWNLDNDDDPEIYAYACPEYTAYRIETQLGVTPPPLLDTFTMQSTITSQAVLAAIAAGSPFYISGTALNSALNAGVQDIPYLFTQSYVTTGITYVCLIEGYKWIALTYLDNAFIGYVIRDLSVQLYLHTISANANDTAYTFRFLDMLSTQITSGAALAQHNKARLISGSIISSNTVGDVRSCGYDPATEMLYLTVALSSGVTTLPIPVNNFQAWYDSVQTWS